MKKLITILCLLVSTPFFAVDDMANPPQNSEVKDVDPALYLQTNWTGDEDFLYLNVKLNPSLKFSNKYTTTLYKNGYSCQINIELPKDSALDYHGQKITSYELKVDLLNGTNNKTLLCDINHIFYTTEECDGTIQTTQHTWSQSEKVTNPALDLNVRPEFVTYKDDSSLGRLVFKNSFPYSQL